MGGVEQYELPLPKQPARAFYFHFDKPKSLQAKRPQISVHWCGACHIVDNIICYVPTKGLLSKRQPRFVMAGKGVLRVQGLGAGSMIGVITND